MGFARPAPSSYTTCWDTTGRDLWHEINLVFSRLEIMYVELRGGRHELPGRAIE
jgi:hypothetical protein